MLLFLFRVREGSEPGALFVLIFWGGNAVNETSSGKLLIFLHYLSDLAEIPCYAEKNFQESVASTSGK